jgi:hypothetical protein
MKLRLLTTLIAAAALGGCATYDYAGGSGSGGYYHGRASTDYYYGPYGGAYGYPGYGGYGYGRYLYGPRHYGPYGYGYRPPYYYRPPHYPRPPRGDDDGDRGSDRPPPWRAPDGRYRDTGQVLVPPSNAAVPQVPRGPVLGEGRRNSPWRAPTAVPRAEAVPQAPRMERSRPVPRMQRESAPSRRESAPSRRESGGQEQVRQLEP